MAGADQRGGVGAGAHEAGVPQPLVDALRRLAASRPRRRVGVRGRRGCAPPSVFRKAAQGFSRLHAGLENRQLGEGRIRVQRLVLAPLGRDSNRGRSGRRPARPLLAPRSAAARPRASPRSGRPRPGRSARSRALAAVGTLGALAPSGRLALRPAALVGPRPLEPPRARLVGRFRRPARPRRRPTRSAGGRRGGRLRPSPLGGARASRLRDGRRRATPRSSQARPAPRPLGGDRVFDDGDVVARLTVPRRRRLPRRWRCPPGRRRHRPRRPRRVRLGGRDELGRRRLGLGRVGGGCRPAPRRRRTRPARRPRARPASLRPAGSSGTVAVRLRRRLGGFCGGLGGGRRPGAASGGGAGRRSSAVAERPRGWRRNPRPSSRTARSSPP